MYTLKVSQLPEGTTEATIRKLFQPYGHFTSVRLLKGYALVNYCSYHSAQEACEKLDGTVLSGTVLRVKRKSSDRESVVQYTVKINNLSTHATESELRDICGRFGIVSSVKVNPGFAYINFLDNEDAQSAANHLNGLDLAGSIMKAKVHHQNTQTNYPPVYQHFPIPPPQSVPSHYSCIPSYLPKQPIDVSFPSTHSSSSSTVKISIFGEGLTTVDLVGYFSQFGTIKGTPAILRGSPNYAYINYHSAVEASNACRQKEVILNHTRVNVKPSDKPALPEKNSLKVSDCDIVVNQLLARRCFERVRKKLELVDVTILPLKEGGLQLTGDTDKVKIAQSVLDTEIQLIKSEIVTEHCKFHFSYVPQFVDPHTFQEIERKHSIEFTVVKNGTSEEKLLPFSSMVAKKSEGSEPMKKTLFEDYCTSLPSLHKPPTWLFTNDNGTFSAMSNVDSISVESLYQQHKSCTNIVNYSLPLNSKQYNFNLMQQTNILTGKVRNIKRFVPNVEHITIQCRGLPQFVSSSLQELKEQLKQTTTTVTVAIDPSFHDVIINLAERFCVEITAHESGITLKRCQSYLDKVKILLKEKSLDLQANSLSGISLNPEPTPSYWEQQTNDIELKDLSSQCSEWLKIKQEVRATLPYACIIKIQRIQNKWLWEKYAFCKQRMMRKNGDQAVNEKRLFHGTRHTSPENIYRSEHGFDFRFGNAGMWGKGAYFASDANYSDSYASTIFNGNQASYASNSLYGNQASYASSIFQEKQMFLAFVLTGHSVHLQSNHQLDKPPLKPGKAERYDSVNGTAGNTQIYIVYDHDKSYPAYLITYK